MEENQYSRTAMMTAFCRGYHALYDDPKIFDDSLAHRIIPEEVRAGLEQYIVAALKSANPEFFASLPDRAAAVGWVIRNNFPTPLFLSRARYTEDTLETAVKQGVKQYVILGAGMDTFAFRRKELMEQLQVFEIDHPATQVFKRSRLAELGWDLPVQLHFIPADFNQESLTEALQRSDYDPQARTFFSWLGVTMYLTRDTVLATLRTITDISPTGSTVIFDYFDPDAFDPEKAAPRVQGMMRQVQKLGEPMKAGFVPSTLDADLHLVGLRLQEQLSPSDIQERYFKGRTDGYYAFENAHFACAVVE